MFEIRGHSLAAPCGSGAAERKTWVAALRADRDPFDAAVLRALANRPLNSSRG